MLRLFANEGERTTFEERARPSLQGLVRSPDPAPDPTAFTAPHGGFEMASAGRLDVIRYLDASRAVFTRDGGFRLAAIDPTRDLELTSDGVRCAGLGIEAGQVVFCDGLAASANLWCASLRFTPAKGELLTLRIPGLAESRVIHRGVWLSPMGGDLFRAGATYDRADHTLSPTVAGREQIINQLRAFLRLPFEVVGHEVGIRPVVEGGKPVFGTHPEHPQFAFFNGLGSKGALLAPYFAARLVERLTSGAAPRPTSPTRVAEQAHATVRAALRAGDIAIDATAGYGRDTAFLAELVGPTGHVFALDVQPLALERTAALLAARGLSNVTLLHRDHAHLAAAIPAEWRGRVGAVMFHLGALPGGDRSIVSAPESTVSGLRDALVMLRPGGVLTVVWPPGQTGTVEGPRAIREWAETLAGGGGAVRHSTSGDECGAAPRLIVVTREG